MTLKDVAVLANCSVATVSKALKNSSEISESAKQRILSIAKEYGYLKKATTHKAVLGGFKIVIFNDVKGDSFEIYKKLIPLAKKYTLMPIYVSVSTKESKELLNQLGAFGLVLKGVQKAELDEKTILIQNNLDNIEAFLLSISQYKPSRPSRAGKPSSQNNTDKNASNKSQQQDIDKKEEIWLL